MNSRDGSHRLDESLELEMSRRNKFVAAYLNGIHAGSGTHFAFNLDLWNPLGPPSVRAPLLALQPSGHPPRLHRYQQGVNVPQEGTHQYTELQNTVQQGKPEASGTIEKHFRLIKLFETEIFR